MHKCEQQPCAECVGDIQRIDQWFNQPLQKNDTLFGHGIDIRNKLDEAGKDHAKATDYFHSLGSSHADFKKGRIHHTHNMNTLTMGGFGGRYNKHKTFTDQDVQDINKLHAESLTGTPCPHCVNKYLEAVPDEHKDAVLGHVNLFKLMDDSKGAINFLNQYRRFHYMNGRAPNEHEMQDLIKSEQDFGEPLEKRVWGYNYGPIIERPFSQLALFVAGALGPTEHEIYREKLRQYRQDLATYNRKQNRHERIKNALNKQKDRMHEKKWRAQNAAYGAHQKAVRNYDRQYAKRMKNYEQQKQDWARNVQDVFAENMIRPDFHDHLTIPEWRGTPPKRSPDIHRKQQEFMRQYNDWRVENGHQPQVGPHPFTKAIDEMDNMFIKLEKGWIDRKEPDVYNADLTDTEEWPSIQAEHLNNIRQHRDAMSHHDILADQHKAAGNFELARQHQKMWMNHLRRIDELKVPEFMASLDYGSPYKSSIGDIPFPPREEITGAFANQFIPHEADQKLNKPVYAHLSPIGKRAASFRGIDTEDPGQMRALTFPEERPLFELEHPGSNWYKELMDRKGPSMETIPGAFARRADQQPGFKKSEIDITDDMFTKLEKTEHPGAKQALLDHYNAGLYHSYASGAASANGIKAPMHGIQSRNHMVRAHQLIQDFGLSYPREEEKHQWGEIQPGTPHSLDSLVYKDEHGLGCHHCDALTQSAHFK